MRSFVLTFLIIMFVFSPISAPCEAARLVYKEKAKPNSSCCDCCNPKTKPKCCVCKDQVCPTRKGKTHSKP
ncbi:hypothetical protein CASFOL_024947 [Castilleja foliolosa]|uniref:TNFR-Cys domain-containing protein n=1 Tax=Castilleja foliolosa TaxID=1961234 RepID=A0ABD3CPS9_9LAMI